LIRMCLLQIGKDRKKMSETKEQVFEALLKEYLGGSVEWNAHKHINEWRERYEKAEAEMFGKCHDVEDLYESPIEGQEE